MVILTYHAGYIIQLFGDANLLFYIVYVGFFLSPILNTFPFSVSCPIPVLYANFPAGFSHY